MARLAVLTDRLPDDPSWKGAYIWEIIRGLAESQHEVAVFTTEDPERISMTHPRLTVARPAPAWSVDRMARWAQALLNYRPEVIHTFALKESTLWPRLTVWPYLDVLCKVLPGTKRISTMFETEDFAPAATWHSGSSHWTVFSPEQAAAARLVFNGKVEVAPIDDLMWPACEEDQAFDERGFLLVGAPVSEWRERTETLKQIAAQLRAEPALHVWINGGWGDLSLSERKQGWQALMDVSSRVRLIEMQGLRGFFARAQAAGKIWTEGLPQDSWRRLITLRIAKQLGKEPVGASRESAVLASGSTTNFLSRIYLS
jgi:hypothetical protein